MAVIIPPLDLSTLKSGPLLVTGHTGFKGTWLTMLLENLGIEVIGLSLPALNQSLYNRLSRIGKIQEFFVDVRSNDEIQAVLRKVRPGTQRLERLGCLRQKKNWTNRPDPNNDGISRLSRSRHYWCLRCTFSERSSVSYTGQKS